ncbi:hypothetical protein, partial [Salmonella enterica]|uniref:hypothetical protein n=1 Tax=Salmonella enterica TaxID=28901 RepID=UPI003297E685
SRHPAAAVTDQLGIFAEQGAQLVEISSPHGICECAQEPPMDLLRHGPPRPRFPQLLLRAAHELTAGRFGLPEDAG